MTIVLVLLLFVALLPVPALAQIFDCYSGQGRVHIDGKAKFEWNPKSEVDATVDVQLRRQGSETIEQDSHDVKIDQESVIFQNLKPGTAYLVTIANKKFGIKSAYRSCVFATDAKEMPVATIYAKWLYNGINLFDSKYDSVRYTGPLSSDGTMTGKLVGDFYFSINHHDFRYDGELLNGEPDGSGIFEDLNDRQLPDCITLRSGGHVCRDSCVDTKFSAGLLVAGNCTIIIQNIGPNYSWPKTNGGRLEGAYQGAVGRPTQTTAANFFGPLRIAFEGHGTASFPEALMTIEGSWKDSVFEGEGVWSQEYVEQRGIFRRSQHVDGYNFNFLDLSRTTVSQLKNGIEEQEYVFGQKSFQWFKPWLMERSGITGSQDADMLGFSINDTRSGSRIFRPAGVSGASACSSSEDFGLPLNASATNDFRVFATNHLPKNLNAPTPGEPNTDYWLVLDKSAIRILAFRSKSLPPVFRILTGAKADDGSKLLLDKNEEIDLSRKTAAGDQFEAPYVVARLCDSKTISTAGRESSLADACPYALTFLGRLYYCDQ